MNTLLSYIFNKNNKANQEKSAKIIQKWWRQNQWKIYYSIPNVELNVDLQLNYDSYLDSDSDYESDCDEKYKKLFINDNNFINDFYNSLFNFFTMIYFNFFNILFT